MVHFAQLRGVGFWDNLVVETGTPTATPTLRSLRAADLSALARGCAVFASGGGGDPFAAMQMAQAAIAEHGPVRLVTLEELPQDGMVMPTSLVGSPTVTLEKLGSGDEGSRLVAEMERALGQPVVALMPSQIGGACGILPVSWAAGLGLPVVDADGMGRAYPTMEQSTMNLAGISASPCVLCDERCDTVVVRAALPARVEELVRSTVAASGGACAAASFPMVVADAYDAIVHGSVSRACAIGAALMASADEDYDPAVASALGATELVRGHVVTVERQQTEGFVRGTAVVQDVAGRLIRLVLQNEYLVALEDGEVRAIVPDIISVLDLQTGEIVQTERLRVGRHVSVLAFACDPVWQSAEGLALGGPSAFGYDIDYCRLERPDDRS